MGGEKRITFTKAPEKIIMETIAKFIKENPANRRKVDGGRYWDTPLVGFASGEDPLFSQYKKIIGKFHLTPNEIFGLTVGKEGYSKDVSVISWILPASKDVRKSNRIRTKFPSFLWFHNYAFGEQFNIKLRNHLVSFLKRKGYRAVAPHNSPYFKRLRSSKVGRTSNWSERHIAYACGLGAFGLNDGLITSKGQAMRVGSVVTDLHLRATEKIYPHPQANCLYYFNHTCKACIKRCPVGAITTKGHDKDKCYDYLYHFVFPIKKDEYGVETPGACGLCQTKVPCEFEIPKLIEKEYTKKRLKKNL
jgi:epoxyqueuosine reductase QueG